MVSAIVGSERTPNTTVELDKCKKIDADKRTEAKKLTRDLGIWGVRSPCSGSGMTTGIFPS